MLKLKTLIRFQLTRTADIVGSLQGQLIGFETRKTDSQHLVYVKNASHSGSLIAAGDVVLNINVVYHVYLVNRDSQ